MHVDILDAHLALGRLTERLGNPGDCAVWRSDALRREAMASLRLDGRMVGTEDLALGLLHAGRPMRDDVAQGVRIVTAAERLLGSAGTVASREVGRRLSPQVQRSLDEDGPLPEGDEDPDEDLDDLLDDGEGHPPAPVMGSAEDAIAATRAALAAGEAALAGAPFGEPAAASPPLPPPLSGPWLALAWTRLVGSLDAEDRGRLDDAALLIDEGLQRPGLLGVAAALHILHRPGRWPEPPAPAYGSLDVPTRDERAAWMRGDGATAARLAEEREAAAERLRLAAAETHQAGGAGWRLCRLIVPWLIQRACALPFPGPWVSEALAQQARRDYQAVSELSLDAWTRRFCRSLAEGCDRDRARLADLHRLLDDWERRLAHGRVRRAGKTVGALLLLLDNPAIDSATLARRRGIKRRMAQALLHDLERAGIVHEVTGRYSERVWVAAGLR